MAELPSAPCLSSRVETGLRIEPETLAFIHAVEGLVDSTLGPSHARRAVRCRVRAEGVVIELDPASLADLLPPERDMLSREIAAAAPPLAGEGVRFQPYRVGSAFLTGDAA